MTKWSQTKEEYEHIRKIMLDQNNYGPASILMKDETIIEGFITGLSSGNNISENMRAGRGPIATSLHGELKVELEDGQTVTLSALDIYGVKAKSN